ncbi:MAG: hypothetical protein Pg6C_00890 [Treponemataceae bacterium]|nr:MAG: hypothetical protein Pg6C_00890 [Treponemataceae bacterium]
MKSNKKKRSGLLPGFAVLCIAAIFSFTLAGCDNGTDPGGGDGGDTITPDPPWTGTPVYSLGDTGPGGGKIFYVSQTGFTMTDNNTTAHYLEAAPADSGTKAWGTYGTDISGTATALGTGRKNTALILADANARAAKACKDLTTGGKTDWFLPSKDELNYLYTNRSYVGNLQTVEDTTNWTHIYWSSSQPSDNRHAMWQRFSNGYQGEEDKPELYSVRAVRAF